MNYFWSWKYFIFDEDKTEREGPTKFSDFLWKVRRLGGSVALADVKDIQLEDGFLGQDKGENRNLFCWLIELNS